MKNQHIILEGGNFLKRIISALSLNLTNKKKKKTSFNTTRKTTSKTKVIDWTNRDKYVENIKASFKNCYGYDLDLNNPKTLSEKMMWLRVYDNTPLKTQCADKYLVREYIKQKIGEEYLIPLLGVYDKFDEIDFEKLPNQFVIKCNHGCGYNIIVKDKSTLDINEAKDKINKWMNENYGNKYGEIHYSPIKRKIIIEKFLNFQEENDGIEYKVFCYNGLAKYCLIELDFYGNNPKRAYCDRDFNAVPFQIGTIEKSSLNNKPDFFDKMIDIAELLSKDFKHVRVDFYYNKQRLYIGELTFTSGGGYSKYYPEEWNLKLGNLLDLNN